MAYGLLTFSRCMLRIWSGEAQDMVPPRDWRSVRTARAAVNGQNDKKVGAGKTKVSRNYGAEAGAYIS